MTDTGRAGDDPALPVPVNHANHDDGERRSDELPAETLGRLLEIEKLRIDRDNRRTEVLRQFVEMNNASDERQYNAFVAELDAEKAGNERRHSLACRLLGGVGFVVVILSIFLFYMAFFGEADQQVLATRFLTYMLTGLGGYGVLSVLGRWMRRMLEPPS
ncbi:MAG: hypothetical protein AB7P02_13290 [Alphaproteobacteria bacterium]